MENGEVKVVRKSPLDGEVNELQGFIKSRNNRLFQLQVGSKIYYLMNDEWDIQDSIDVALEASHNEFEAKMRQVRDDEEDNWKYIED